MQENKRICQCISAHGKLYQDFYVEHSKAASRGCDAAEEWIGRMASFGLPRHFAAFMANLRSYAVLEACSFVLDRYETQGLSPEDVDEEDDFSNLLGMFAVLSVGFRVKRMARCLVAITGAMGFLIKRIRRLQNPGTIKRKRRN